VRIAQKSDPAAATSAPRKQARPLVYVVDDEPMLLELAVVVLEPQGYEVKTFRDPEESLRTFAAAVPKPALVITDYAMHNRNGMDLVIECKKLQPGQRVILVSGTVGQEVFENSTVKPDAFLPKPYRADQLRNMVKALIG
jgi:DNA-binding NtrC family response regulator